MAAALEYERVRYSERMMMSTRVRAVLLFLCCAPVIVNSILFIALGRRIGAWCLIGTAISTAASIFAYSIQAITQVFGDRLQVNLFAGTLRLWNYQYPWRQLGAIESVAQNAPGNNRRATVLRRAPDLTIIMYSGVGIRLTLLPLGQVWIGSHDPARLLAEIDTARAAGQEDSIG